MFLKLPYERVVELAHHVSADWDSTGPLNFSMQMQICEREDQPIVMSAHLVLERPAIIDVISPSRPDWLHAVYWDGEHLHDPLPGSPVDRRYALNKAVCFTQRLLDIAPLIIDRFHLSQTSTITTATGLEQSQEAAAA